MPAPPVSGHEWCCFVGEDDQQCPNQATWTSIYGEPAYDHATDVCEEHKDVYAGTVYPLIPGECHPCLTGSRAAVEEAESAWRNTRKDRA